MADLGEILNEEGERMRAMREELRVQLHLGRAEVRDRWEQLEKDWQQLEGKLALLRRESREELESVGEAARELLKQIRSGYEHLKSLV